MTRIVYGLSGEGSGHSSRAREMITHLLEGGHEVKAVSYDRGYRNLREDFDVFETEGLHIESVDNKVSVVRTFTENLSRLGDGIRKLRELREVFLSDLAGCKAVVASAGFTLMTEALQLRKPMLAHPLRGQFEQELNALLLEQSGCGKNGREGHADAIGDFFYRLPEFAAALAEREPDDQQAIKLELDRLVAGGGALAREFRGRRQGAG